MGPSSPDRAPPIAVLQFMRGVAALLVVTCHLFQRLARRDMVGADLAPLINYLGYVGVALFFAISGFVMIHTTGRRFGCGDQAMDFIKRRLFRIFPLYYTTTLATIVFTLATLRGSADYWSKLPSLKEMMLSLLFVPYMNGDGAIQPIYLLGWSLNFEMFFYVLFAGVMLLPMRRGLVALGAVLTSLTLVGSRLGYPDDDSSFVQVALYFYTRPVLLYFLIGLGIGVLRTQTRARLGLRDAHAALICLILVICGVAGQTVATGETAMLQGHISTYLAIGLALAVAVFCDGESTPDHAISRRFRHLGDVSYSIYLTHSFLLGAVAFGASRLGAHGGVALAALCIVAWAICILVAHATWRWLEKPASLWLSRRPLMTLGGVQADSASVAP